MTHALLPDFSRLTLSTGARDSVRDEIMAERYEAEVAYLLRGPNSLIERAIVQLGDTDNLDSLRSAAAAAQRYKDVLDAMRSQDRAILRTSAWQASIRRHAAFLEAALEALVDLDTELQAEMFNSTDTIDGQAYQDRRAVLEAILTADDGTPWKYDGAYNAHADKLRNAMATIRRTLEILATRPDATQEEEERELWRQDLLEVMRQAKLTRTTGEVDVVLALADRRRERGGGGGGRGDAYQAHYDMAIPELTPHMQLIFDLLMREVNDIKEMILRNGMGPGQYVEETVDFGEFELGRATIKVYTSRQRTFHIRWFRYVDDTEPMDIQGFIGGESRTLRTTARSVPDLKRWLDWLDQNVLDDSARHAARTWTRDAPVRSQRVVGSGS